MTKRKNTYYLWSNDLHTWIIISKKETKRLLSIKLIKRDGTCLFKDFNEKYFWYVSIKDEIDEPWDRIC